MSYVDDIREYRPKNLPLMRRVLDMFHEYGFYEEELSLLNRMMKEIESRDEEYCTLLLRCVKVNRIRKHFKEALKQLELYNSLVQNSLKEKPFNKSWQKNLQYEIALWLLLTPILRSLTHQLLFTICYIPFKLFVIIRIWLLDICWCVLVAVN